ncbi:MAG: hypothetical protein V7K42_16870 [Nostoc sp.]
MIYDYKFIDAKHQFIEGKRYELSMPEMLPARRRGFMNKKVENEIEDESRPEYEFAEMASSHKPNIERFQ